MVRANGRNFVTFPYEFLLEKHMKLSTYTRLFVGIFVTLLLANLTACQKSDTNAAEPDALASFGLMQQKILTPSCATSGCHASEQDPSFAQHGLVLAAGVS